MKTRDKERTKRIIVEAAISLFKTYGLLGTTTLDIANKANVAHGTVFYYYPKRADLIVAAIYQAMEEMGYKLHEQSRYTDDIKKLCDLFIDGVIENQELYTVIAREVPLLPLNVQRMVFASLSGFSVHFVDVIRRAQKRGKAKKFTPHLAVFYWFGMINYICSYPEMLGSKKTLQTHKKALIKMFVALVST